MTTTPVLYPRAADQSPAHDVAADGPRQGLTILTDALGAIGVVWGVALAVLAVGIPIALAVALVLWLGRLAFGAI